MEDIICWWSGGVTSAVACHLAIELFGADRCRVVMIDTFNEDEDTYRFKRDCEAWYGMPIEVITAIGTEWSSIQAVWRRFMSLNVATGAICSTHLKRLAREKWQKANHYTHQVFGFEFEKKEFNRALGLTRNHGAAKGIYPLLMHGYTKEDCIAIVEAAGLAIPRMYKLGFRNNNCFGTGCVQGGIGYWQKMQRDYPDKFDTMAEMEHELTDMKGQPVTMLKDQSNAAKQLVTETGDAWRAFVFLKPHPHYPQLKSLKDMPAREVQPLFDCNGFCGVNDFAERSQTETEINYEE